MLETIEIETAPHPDAAVIWMHGLGADGNDFVPVVDELKPALATGVRFVFPNAPVRPVTINNGYRMRAWYDVTHEDLEGRSRRADEQGMRASVAEIVKLIVRENGRGIATRSIVLAGFSQGGAIALAAALRYPERLAGVMALSTYLPLADSLPAEASAVNRDVPVFYAHGTADPVVPYALAVASRATLSALAYRVELHDYPMPHSVCMEEIADIAAWLRTVLSA
jgi:phospholipase/carboxylesterase